MWTFLQTYGIWILFGLYFLWMLRMHASGRGCGMGHTQHPSDRSGQDGRQHEEDTEAYRPGAARDDAWQEEERLAEPIATNHRSSACH